MVILVIFLIVAVVISQLVGRMQASLAAATAREREATQLYELSTALAGLHDGHAIAQILAKQVQAVSQGEVVELNITGAQSFAFRLPEIRSTDSSARMDCSHTGGARCSRGDSALESGTSHNVQ